MGLTNEMIQDRLVVGIRDSTLSERLQMDPDLMLDKAKKLIRKCEAVQEQQEILKNGEKSKPTMLCAIKRHKPFLKRHSYSQKPQSTPQKALTGARGVEKIHILGKMPSKRSHMSQMSKEGPLQCCVFL